MFVKSKVIYGCEGRGDADSPYLTRWTLLQTPWGNLNLHLFHRSDADEMHDHPWPFVSLVLWPGYQEVYKLSGGPFIPSFSYVNKRRPFSLAFRPADWRHRVQLLKAPCPYSSLPAGMFCALGKCSLCHGTQEVERPCYTLIWTGQRVREWGFFTAKGWQPWRDYFKQNGC